MPQAAFGHAFLQLRSLGVRQGRHLIDDLLWLNSADR